MDMMDQPPASLSNEPQGQADTPAPASRKFYDISDNNTDITLASEEDKEIFSETEQLVDKQKSFLKYIEDNVVGNDKEFIGPFGKRRVEYCDYTASGRSLAFIEDYIRHEVLPDYGNTHTMTTVTSLQTTLFRHEARDIVRNAVNAGEHDSVLFVGSGCTGAVHKLIHAMMLEAPPIVIVGPFEHHSNLLPWRELGSKINQVQETSNGQLDLEHLEELLQQNQSAGRQIVGAFSAASNITGTLVDVDAVTVMLHRYGALAFWDYATAGPYVDININPVIPNVNPELVSKDAVFISPHKFVGGVQTPGILVAKKRLFKNSAPLTSGGGSVFFVRRDSHRYLQEVEMREEGGTPAIVESIRAGLVFQLKQAVGSAVIMNREEKLVRQAFDYWRDVPSLVILGSHSAPRLPIFSFLIRHPQTGLYLHYNYICTLLNDLFGIQSRGGCACAGPYAEDLLGIDEELATKYESLLVEDTQLDRTHLRRYREYSHREVLRPGFTRLNLPYFMDDDRVDFILEAVKLVAEEGWKLMPQYNFNPETGEWRHKHHQVFRDRSWLGYVSYKSGRMTNHRPSGAKSGDKKAAQAPNTHQECLDTARKILASVHKTNTSLPDQTAMFDVAAAPYRWFLLPSEAVGCLQSQNQQQKNIVREPPFTPVTYPRPVQTRNAEICSEVANSTLCSFSMPHRKHESSKVDIRGSERAKTFEQGLTNLLTEGFGQTESVSGDQGNMDVDQQKNNSDTTSDQTSEVPSKECSMSVSESSEKLQSSQVKETLAGSSTEHIQMDTTNSDVHNRDSVSEITKRDLQETKVVSQSGPVTNKPQTTTIKSDQHCDIKSRKKIKLTKDPHGRHKWHPPPKTIFKPMVQALEEFEMIKDRDRVLVCLSGGKDSLSLLHSLHQYQYYAKSKGIQFDLGAVTIDPQTESYDPSPLKGYLKELDVPYFFEEQCIMETAQNLPYECASICSFCSRMKRGRIYHTARREKYNVLALGQHLDDLAESFLMSVFQNGILRTMKASYTVQAGDLRVVRPLVYVRETDLRRFAEENSLPVIAENCPACFETPKERHRMKQLLASQEIIHPRLFPSILAAIKPIFSINKTGVSVRELLSLNTEPGDDEGDIEDT